MYSIKLIQFFKQFYDAHHNAAAKFLSVDFVQKHYITREVALAFFLNDNLTTFHAH